MSTPNIDKRDRNIMLTQLENLAAQQVPELTGEKIEEWKAKKDVGYALIQIFSHMAEHTVTQLNKVPEKKLIAYLNMIGTNLLCAQPARTPIHFVLSQGALEGIPIPAGTQVATLAKDESPAVVFETERPITATISQIRAIISTDSSLDEVYDNLNELTSSKKKETELFVSPPMQEHALYLGHESLFNLHEGVRNGTTEIELTVDSTDASLSSKTKWSFSCQNTGEEEKDWIEFTKVDFKSAGDGKELITLTKNVPTSTAKKSVNGIKTFWIRATMDTLSTTLPTVKSIQAKIRNKVYPDSAFYNDVPIDLTSEFFPFGTQPNTSDVFYIGSQEGFSKKGSTVTINFGAITLGNPKNTVGGPLLLSWEFWDGKSWANLSWANPEDGKPIHGFQKKISFVCPNIVPTKVSSKENYWIRVRIVSGNYGINIPPATVIQDDTLTKVAKSEIELVTLIQDDTLTKVAKSGIELDPPQINDIAIENIYSEPIDLEQIVTKNNLQYNDLTHNLFKPFVPLEEKNQMLYLGFDKPLGEGIISVFFALRKREYMNDKKPRIVWSYLRTFPKEEWVSIQVADTTNNLTTSGAVEFLAPNDMNPGEKFGKTLYWIRGEVIGNPFQSIGKTVSDLIDASDSENTETNGNASIEIRQGQIEFIHPNKKDLLNKTLWHQANEFRAKTHAKKHELLFEQPTTIIGQPCDAMEIYHPKFSVLNVIKDFPAAPIAYAVSLNTTLAVQAETVTDELLGTSDGLITKPLDLSRKPVISESILIKEPNLPNEKEATITTTATGEKWVQWRVVGDFIDCKENSRNYLIDRVFGKITFGNGVNGMIPPVGSIIKATYQTGGGIKGNVSSGEVKNLVTAIAFVDKAVNIDEAQGGSETENVERAKKRGPKLVQHRQRAVAREDYEWLSLEASGDVARAKCIPNLNSEGKQESGCVAIIIIPEGTEDKPIPSPRLLQIVEDYIKNRCPLSIASLTVTEPTYLGISVTADIYVTSIDSASSVNFTTINKIKKFLHPLHGGSGGQGWDFGMVPCNSDILAILPGIKGVDHVENLTVTISEEQSGSSFSENGSVILPGYTMIYSGTHQLNVELTEGV